MEAIPCGSIIRKIRKDRMNQMKVQVRHIVS